MKLTAPVLTFSSFASALPTGARDGPIVQSAARIATTVQTYPPNANWETWWDIKNRHRTMTGRDSISPVVPSC